MLADSRPPVYSILNDPDTGIRLPDRENQREGLSHVNLATIASQVKNAEVRCVVTFDQSHHREAGFSPRDQRNAKVLWLQRAGLYAFYYVSHAPFLFAFSERTHMKKVQTLLRAAGVPNSRIKVPE